MWEYFSFHFFGYNVTTILWVLIWRLFFTVYSKIPSCTSLISWFQSNVKVIIAYKYSLKKKILCGRSSPFFHGLSDLAPSKKPGFRFRLLGAVFVNFFYRLRLPLKRLRIVFRGFLPTLACSKFVFTAPAPYKFVYPPGFPLTRPGSRL